jgi:hypothetical protein
MKRGVLGFSLLIFLTNFVSAQFYSGYNRFSITGFFESIDPQDMTLMVLFIVLLAFINMATSKIFRNRYGEPDRAKAGGVAFFVTLFMVYGIHKTGFDFENLFYGLGISNDFLFLIISIIFLIAAIYMSKKVGFAGLLMVLGLLLSLITISTDLIYEKGMALIIGIVVFLVGLGLWWRRRKGGGWPRGLGNDSFDVGYGGGSRGPGFLKKRWGQYSDYKTAKQEQRYGQKLAEQQKDWEKKIHQKEVRERAKRIGAIRKRREGKRPSRGVGEEVAEAQREQEMKQRREVERAHAEALKENKRRMQQQKADRAHEEALKYWKNTGRKKGK